MRMFLATFANIIGAVVLVSIVLPWSVVRVDSHVRRTHTMQVLDRDCSRINHVLVCGTLL